MPYWMLMPSYNALLNSQYTMNIFLCKWENYCKFPYWGIYKPSGKIIRLEDVTQDAHYTQYHQKVKSAKVHQKNVKGKQQGSQC